MGVQSMLSAVVVGAVYAHANMCDTVLPIPVVMWSSAPNVLSGVNEYYGLEASGVDQNRVTSLVERCSWAAQMTGDEEFLKFTEASERQIADAVVVFMANELSRDDLSLSSISFLQKIIESSKGSLVMPATFSSTKPGVQTAWSSWFSKHEQAIIIEEETASQQISSALDGRSNGQPVALLVNLDNDTNLWEEQVGKVLAAVEAKTDKSLAVLTALKHKDVHINDVHEPTNIEQERELQILAIPLGVLPFAIPVRITPNTVIGLIFSLILVLVTMLYICCLEDTRGTNRFVKKYPPKGKVFN